MPNGCVDFRFHQLGVGWRSTAIPLGFFFVVVTKQIAFRFGIVGIRAYNIHFDLQLGACPAQTRTSVLPSGPEMLFATR